MIDLEKIQPKMRPVVEFLNQNGFKTTDSGDGVTNVEAGMEGAMNFPHVVVNLGETLLIPELVASVKRLTALMQTQNFGFGDGDIEVSYSVTTGLALVIISWQQP